MRAFLGIVLLASIAVSAEASDGLVAIKSAYGAKQTVDRFEDAARQRGLNIFLRVDHAAGAQKIGKALRPTELIVFGNPQGGTPLMQCSQAIGIDLPLKALAWTDPAGDTWLAYNDPLYLVERHGARDCRSVAEKLSKVLDALARSAADH